MKYHFPKIALLKQIAVCSFSLCLSFPAFSSGGGGGGGSGDVPPTVVMKLVLTPT